MSKRSRSLRCPICKKRVKLRSALAPFCSERCRLLDLGNWASERYLIRSPLPDTEQAEEARMRTERSNKEER